MTKILLLLAFAASGCSDFPLNGSGDAGPPPVVDAIAFPAYAAIGSDGLYDLAGTMSFHAPAGTTVSAIHVVSTTLQTDSQIAITPVNQVTNSPVTINFNANNAAGTSAAYSVSVIDSAGAESAALSGTVTLTE